MRYYYLVFLYNFGEKMGKTVDDGDDYDYGYDEDYG